MAGFKPPPPIKQPSDPETTDETAAATTRRRGSDPLLGDDNTSSGPSSSGQSDLLDLPDQSITPIRPNAPRFSLEQQQSALGVVSRPPPYQHQEPYPVQPPPRQPMPTDSWQPPQPPPQAQQQHSQPPQSQQPRQQQQQEQQQQQWVTSFNFRRSRTYAFVVDGQGRPVEIGSGRFARVYLGQEKWLESVTDLQRDVVIKMMHKGMSPDEASRFRMEKELLERVQGHPNIVELLGSGDCSDPRLPAAIRDQTEGDFVILEKLDMNLEERIKGSRDPQKKEDLLAFDMHDRLLRVLEYMIPIASAVEYAHVVRNVCHRDINPANVLIGLADPYLAGSRMQVRLADFGVAKLQQDGPGGEGQPQLTRFAHGVPGTMYFQSPEQETNIREILVNVTHGSPEVEYFEDFYVNVAKNDTFGIFNSQDEYSVIATDRVRKRIVLQQPYMQRSETNIRARVQKSVGRPADVYALGGLFYYLITGATGNPKVLYDTFSKFIEYERNDESNTIDAYLRHDYQTLQQLQSSKSPKATGAPDTAPANRFFSYQHFFDGNGELIHPAVMTIIARAMIRNKPDSYCQTYEVDTLGITNLVSNLTTLYSLYGISGTAPQHFPLRRNRSTNTLAEYGARTSGAIRKLYEDFVLPLFRK